MTPLTIYTNLEIYWSQYSVSMPHVLHISYTIHFDVLVQYILLHGRWLCEFAFGNKSTVTSICMKSEAAFYVVCFLQSGFPETKAWPSWQPLWWVKVLIQKMFLKSYQRIPEECSRSFGSNFCCLLSNRFSIKYKYEGTKIDMSKEIQINNHIINELDYNDGHYIFL